jgi:hypothetical protein
MDQVLQTKINLACGGVFALGDGYVNLNYIASDTVVSL